MRALEHRVPPPLVVFILGFAMWLIARFTPHASLPGNVAVILGALVFVVGLLIGGSGFRAFGRAKTTFDPVNLEAASVLVTTGIFSLSRNPMYVGFTALLTAWTLFLNAPWSLVGVVAFVLFTLRFQVLPEERVMRAKFGSAYEDYRSQVRRWL